MATTINASASSGLITTADTSTILQLQTGGTTAVTVDASQNVGVGVTPSAWDTNRKVFQIGGSGALWTSTSGNGTLFLSNNTYYDGTNFRYLTTGATTYCALATDGSYAWYRAPSGTAGNAISWTQAMTLDASGNLGLGTSSPQAYTGFTVLTVDNATNGGIVSIRKNGTVYGNISPTSNNMTIDAVQASAAIVFRTGSGSDERARIDSSGNLLVGNTTASSVSGSGLKFLNDLDGAGDDRIAIVCASSTTAAPLTLYSTGASAYRFYVSANGTINATVTTITAISDARLKENIRDLDDGLEKVMALQPRKFDWKEGKGKDIKGDRGWIAQEFEQVFPDMIGTWLDEPPEGEDPYKSVRADLIPTLVKAIQEQQAIIQTLTDRITALEGTTP